MRSATKIAALALLVLVSAGCGRKQPKVAPAPAAQAPSVPPTQMATQIPPVPPAIPENAERTVKLDTVPPPETASAPAPAHPKKSPHHKPKPAPAETAQQQQETAKPAQPTPPPSTEPPAPASEVAAGQQPSEESPIGQLSTANENANTADRRDLVNLINSIETGLNAIHRPLSSDEQKTVAQVRTFITRAREALKADDLDGARTLSTKAHLLLQELTKE